MRKMNFGKNVRIYWLMVFVIMMFTPADIFVTNTKGISSVLCPPCSNWNGYYCVLPPGCICCFGICCWSQDCKDCGDNPNVSPPCIYLCVPSQCEVCKGGGCLPGVCEYEQYESQEPVIKCYCEANYCEGDGVFYFYYCNSEECGGDCYCKITKAELILWKYPICRDIGWEPPGPECDETYDCEFQGWDETIGVTTAGCNCEPYPT